MIAVLLRCLLMYGAVILAVRLMGKRQIGELQPAELVITILISELASMPIQDLHLPIISAIFPIFALVALEILISLIALKSVRARSVLYGNPVILIYRGKFRQKAMESARVTIDDILEVMRNDGISDISEIDFAILETNGQLSVIEKNEYKAVCAKDLNVINEESGLPHLIVMDGKLLKNNMKECDLTEKWIEKQLQKRKITSVKQVFLMTVDDRKKVYLVEKE
ncbi:MAG: DUF421 domain-containing protein [Clostridia bacterium]|nr:DUF421 domain-containing protein [Clostridia bacterium]